MDNDKLIDIQINPLQFLEVDEPWSKSYEKEPTLESVLNFLCTPGIGSDISSIVKRYKKISTEKKRIFAAPAEQRILDKLIWPLRHAKSGYMIGNYLGSIALCGMVAEMVAVLLFEISNFKLNNSDMGPQEEESLFGRKFEKLGQERRVQILKVYGIVDQETKTRFESIRKTRNKYLHLWSHDHEQLPKDAILCFNNAVNIVLSVLGLNIDDGKLYLNPALVAYLSNESIMRDVK